VSERTNYASYQSEVLKKETESPIKEGGDKPEPGDQREFLITLTLQIQLLEVVAYGGSEKLILCRAQELSQEQKQRESTVSLPGMKEGR
jgi:hypothetical protein